MPFGLVTLQGISFLEMVTDPRAKMRSTSALVAYDPPLSYVGAIALVSGSELLSIYDENVTAQQVIQLSSVSLLGVDTETASGALLRSSSYLQVATGGATNYTFSFTTNFTIDTPDTLAQADQNAASAAPGIPGGGDKAITFTMGFTGQFLLYPVHSGYGYQRAIPGISLTIPAPVALAGKPYVPSFRYDSSSSVAFNIGASHIRVIADPDPDNDPPTSTTHPGSGGTSTYRWLASDIPYTGDYFNTWPSHGAGPDWHSVYPYRPKVRQHQHYGAGDNKYTYSRMVFFNSTYIEHMWLDWGHNIPQPYTWLFCGIPLQYESAHDGHYILDAGRAVPEASLASTRVDSYTPDNLTSRALLLSRRDSELITTNHLVSDGIYAKTAHSWAPRPRVFAGVFNGANSYVAAMDNHAQHIGKGRVTNVSQRYFVTGRAQGHLSDNYASNMALMEIRFFDHALTPTELKGQYTQMASTYKFNLF